jgi:hypothetical protein
MAVNEVGNNKGVFKVPLESRITSRFPFVSLSPFNKLPSEVKYPPVADKETPPSAVGPPRIIVSIDTEEPTAERVASPRYIVFPER